MPQKNKVLAVVGPTGVGKTALAVKLSREYNGVIISADSRQVYRSLDVGTNKEGLPDVWLGRPVRVIDGVAQFLIDIVEPGQRFTLADWLEQSRKLLLEIWENEQLPIVVGGTGLYVTALFEGYVPGQGRYAKQKETVGFRSITLQPDVPREQLYKKSDERFPRIFDALMGEVNLLLSRGVSASWLEAIGLDYRYVVYNITGQLTRQETINQFQQASRQYIRRQLTWWRHHGNVMQVPGFKQANQAVEEFLNSGEKPVM